MEQSEREEGFKQEWQEALDLMYNIFICHDAIVSKSTPKAILHGMQEVMERYRLEMIDMAQQYRRSTPTESRWCNSNGCIRTDTFFCKEEQQWYCHRCAAIMHPECIHYGFEDTKLE